MTPKPLLHLEGAAVLALGLFAYQVHHGGWLMFALLFLVPDLSMVGYAVNARVGALLYNAIHTYVGPIVLGAYAWSEQKSTLLSIALIWICHIGFDRLLGYGLKYPTYFKDTHLDASRHAFAKPA